MNKPAFYIIPYHENSLHHNSEGRVVAIKKMPRNDIILTNTVRKEVMSVRYAISYV